MRLKIILAFALAAAVAVWPVAAFAHEGHRHGKEAKRSRNQKRSRQGSNSPSRAGWPIRPPQLRVFSRARRKRCNCLGRLNHLLSFLSHYCDRPASGRRVAPVHSV